MSKISRRDLLKLAALLPGGFSLSGLLEGNRAQSSPPNIIVLVFDALSAADMSLYGYPRQTTPHITRFAERATVFHSHSSAASFTSPGTASLLTGLYPWTHRAVGYRNPIRRDITSQNLFRAIGIEYTRVAFTQNLMAEVYLDQFHADIDHHLSPASFGLQNFLLGDKLENDPLSRYQALEFFLSDSHPPASLLFGTSERLLSNGPLQASNPGIYPYDNKFFFNIEDVFSGLISKIAELPEPFLAYIHVYPPHAPYFPGERFAGMFEDGWTPGTKQLHALGDRTSKESLQGLRRVYDSYIANLDWEFGIFFDAFQKTGLFQKSHFIVTSEHGEMFERGVYGHDSPLLNEPVVHIPLVISSPGQQNRRDIRFPTNSVDVLPTLVTMAGYDVPGWCEGELLPGFGGKEDPDRSSYSFDAKKCSSFGHLYPATMALRRGNYKMIYYVGYKDYKGYRNDARYETGEFELFDLANDPEERTNLSVQMPEISGPMKALLRAKYQEVSGPLQ